LASRRLTCNKL